MTILLLFNMIKCKIICILFVCSLFFLYPEMLNDLQLDEYTEQVCKVW